MTQAVTKAAVLFELGRPLGVVDLGIPALKPGQVLVDVAFSGVCRSQLLEAQGDRGPDAFLPHTLGHEGVGTVSAVGEGVSKVRPGERVILSWIRGSGADVPSTTYSSDGGAKVNSGAISTFLKRAVVSENRVVPISASIDLKHAALLGCAVPTGAGIVLNTAKVAAGSSVAVFGAGGIGLNAILAAAMTGAKPLIAVDVHEHKLEHAKKAGATHLVNSSKQDAVVAIREITGGRGADYSIETAGRRETMEAALRAAREKGGLCVIAGNLRTGETFAVDPFDLIKGKRLIGTWGGESDPDRDIPRYLDWQATGKLDFGRVETKVYSLNEVNEALEDLRCGRIGRGLIDMERR